MDSSESVRAELQMNNQIVPLTNMSSNSNIFYTEIDSSTLKNSHPSICFSIYKNARKIVSGCIMIKTNNYRRIRHRDGVNFKVIKNGDRIKDYLRCLEKNLENLFTASLFN